MLENENEIPIVEFTFKEEEKSEEERKKELEELIKKRNEILVSLGYPIPGTEENSNDCPRRPR